MALALQSYKTGFEEMSSGATMSDEMSQHISAIQDAFSGGGENDIKQAIKGLIGLSADSRFAHHSKTLEIATQRKEAIDAAGSAIARVNQIAYSGEMATTRESSIIASNILQEAESMMQRNAAALSSQLGVSQDVASEYSKFANPKMRAEVVDKVQSMIYEAAGGSEGTTVRQLLDSLEMQMAGRYRGLRRLITSQPGYLDENGLSNMFEARRLERARSFLSRQEGVSSLTDQYDDMVQSMKSMSMEERRELLAFAQDMVDQSKRGLYRVEEDQFKIASALLVDGQKSVESMQLDEATEKAVRQMRLLQSARETLSGFGTEMDEILSFGGRGSAAGFAPDVIDLTDDERANLFRGLDGEVMGETARPAETAYKRIGKEFFDKPIVKKSAYAAAGLIAASFLYSASKDRTQEEAAGPPLLPGGSAYEAMSQRDPQMPETSMFSGYNEGVGYSVNIEGTREQAESFSRSMGSVARGPVNSTMYKGLPQLGKDPYSQIASSY